jgi:hypothetical protein
MDYTLLIFSIISTKGMSFRYFISDKDWYNELHLEIDYNINSKVEMEKTITNLELTEISFEEIKDYAFTNYMDVAVYENDFLSKDESNTMHYMIDDESDGDRLFYGYWGKSDFKVLKTVEVDDIIKPIVGKFNGKYDLSAKDVYLIPIGESLDEEYALSYVAFTDENDVKLFLSIYEEGEIAPYVFMNSEYDFVVYNSLIFENIKRICPKDLSELLKTKTVILKQPIFVGRDIYN